MKGAIQVSIMLLLTTVSDCAVITGACERDVQCGAGSCCAISLWLRGLRMCTRWGEKEKNATPAATRYYDCWHRIGMCVWLPFFRKRQHRTCPCSPSLLCSRFLDGRYRCSMDLKNVNF